uniref:hypothetical protein n=1 Tax=uncultured Methanobrevibacter sp. TaxID=253161 RepID=UPI0025E6088A
TGDAHQFYLLASASVLCLHFFEEFGYPGGFGMSLMLAATELGIDSIPAYELIKYPYILRDNLPIPEDEILSWELHLDTNPKSISMNMSLLDLIWMRF